MRWSPPLALLVPIATLVSVGHANEGYANHWQTPIQNGRGGRGPLALAEEKGVIVQMFEWTWDSVAAECTNFLGPNGYRFAQVSPPQEHVQGSQWWTDYQPVSYKLTSKRGNRQSFKRMVQTCKEAGVGIVVDTIWNHMSGAHSGIGIGGIKFTHYDYPDTYSDANGDFHHCGLQPNDAIIDYSNRKEVQTCELVGLADLATESEDVRARLVEYTNDLLSLGVEGLRLDAAKHMAASDVLNMTKRLHSAPFITQEVIWGFNEPIQPNEYLGAGEVQEFRYTTALRDAFLEINGVGLWDLKDFDNRGWVPSDKATVFVLNHDTERNGASLNANSPNNVYTLAHIFMLAHPYGHPSILSSYTFFNSDDGAPNNGVGVCIDDGSAGGWFCQHRWAGIAGMVGFRNVVDSVEGEKVVNWTTEGGGRLGFGRGTSGFVVINNADAPWSTRLATSLPPGRYCDVISGRVEGRRCVGVTYTISSDKTLSAVLPPRSALALHVGDASSSPSSPGTKTTVLFGAEATTALGENIYVVGSTPELGGWDPSRAIPLSPATYPTWIGAVTLPPKTAFEYKYVRKERNGSIVWESNPNRKGNAPEEGTKFVQDVWR